jgi:hypothetical protein
VGIDVGRRVAEPIDVIGHIRKSLQEMDEG